MRLIILTMLFVFAGCGTSVRPSWDDSMDQTNFGLTDDQPENSQKTITLKEAMNIRVLRNGVLEFLAELPAGSVLEVFAETAPHNYDYRKSDGRLDRSSTGFLHPVRVLSLPQGSTPAQGLNATAGGLYISASITGSLLEATEKFAAIKPGLPGADFLKYFEMSGKPKYGYSAGLRKRFGDRVNRTAPMSTLSAADQVKWRKIYDELKRAGDRTVDSRRDLMILTYAQGKALSLRFEAEGFVNELGAWSVAVDGTAARHGFANVPCAETMSEVIRQAYKRAGYNHLDDFNSSKGNKLYWSDTAAVVGLSSALNAAGWVPWDATQYRAPAGAIMMHTTGVSPGHTYLSGGDDGRIIVDNGSPKGRDLRVSTARVLDMMYLTGVFFLPPGIQPTSW